MDKDITNHKIQQVVTNPKDVFNILLRPNYRDLLKSEESAFTSGALMRVMGQELEGEVVQHILDGIDIDSNMAEEYPEYGVTINNLIKSLS